MDDVIQIGPAAVALQGHLAWQVQQVGGSPSVFELGVVDAGLHPAAGEFEHARGAFARRHGPAIVRAVPPGERRAEIEPFGDQHRTEHRSLDVNVILAAQIATLPHVDPAT